MSNIQRSTINVQLPTPNPEHRAPNTASQAEPGTPNPEPRLPAAAIAVLWVLAVVAVYTFAYGRSLVRFAQSAAGRFPFISRLLDLLGLGH